MPAEGQELKLNRPVSTAVKQNKNRLMEVVVNSTLWQEVHSADWPDINKDLPVDGILLDLDDTMILSDWFWYLEWRDVHASHGLQLDVDRWANELNDLWGPDLVVDLEGRLGRTLSDETAADLVERATSRAERRNENHGIRDGVRNLIRDAEQMNLKLGIVTCGDSAWVKRHLPPEIYAKFDPEYIITSDDVKCVKPHPEGFLLAARAMKVRPGRLIGCDNTPKGTLAMSLAGIYSVATPSPITDGLTFANCDAVIDFAKTDLSNLIARLPATPTAWNVYPRPTTQTGPTPNARTMPLTFGRGAA
jgi:HAD superfamily hydrolase (TIGR01509 family)